MGGILVVINFVLKINIFRKEVLLRIQLVLFKDII